MRRRVAKIDDNAFGFRYVLGCMSPALAYDAPDETSEEETIAPQKLTPVYMGAPPYGKASDYNIEESFEEYSVGFRKNLGSAVRSLH